MPKFELPALPYAFDALEPHIDAMTMEIHHDKHHAAYVANLNGALDKHPELFDRSLDEPARRSFERARGHPHGRAQQRRRPRQPQLLLGAPERQRRRDSRAAISATPSTATFGSFDAFKELFTAAGMTRFGSGWAWLSVDGGGKLVVSSTANQDTPISEGLTPVLGLDVWEHAYYLKYQNRRPDYIGAFWNVINWNQAAENFKNAQG